MTMPFGARLLRLLLTALFLGVLAALTFQAARSLAAALERTVSYRYFDEAVTSLPNVFQSVAWLTPTQPLDREVSDSDQLVVGMRITEAWAAHANALASGNVAYLPDHFSGVALKRARLSVAETGARMVVLHQDLRPTFHQIDGSLLQVETTALTARFMVKDGDLTGYRLTRDATVTTLINEATGWRIFSHEREGAEDVVPAQAVYPSDARLAGINYYPAATPWSRFWPEFDRTVVAADMALIRGLGANAVRIFLQRKAFLDPAVAEGNLEDLTILLNEANLAGLKVVPTLFDMRSGYEPGLWADDYRWLQTVLPVLQAAPNIAYVDLKNEPDLDFAGHGRGNVKAWLLTMSAAIRQLAPGMPLTIGWSNAETAPIMSDLVDLVTYHDYKPVDTAAARLADLRRKISAKPVHVTEIGASSWSMAFGLFPHSRQSQKFDLSARTDALADAEGLFLWTLHDFPDPDAAAIGRSPWRRGLQSNFGLVAADGEEKPAASIVRAAFSRILSGTVP
jgi:hypothetical protein